MAEAMPAGVKGSPLQNATAKDDTWWVRKLNAKQAQRAGAEP